MKWKVRIAFYGLSIVALLIAVGCATVPVAAKPPLTPPDAIVNQITHPVLSMARTLGEIDSLMNMVVALSVMAFGIGVVLMIYLRSSIGLSLMFGGGATLVLGILVKSTLWFIPWIAGSIVVIGAIIFIVDVKKRGLAGAWHDVTDIVTPKS